VRCKPWPSRNGGRFTKEDFAIRLASGEVECPAGAVVRLTVGASSAHFPAATCNACAQHDSCTTSTRGRAISIHPQEELLIELRTARRTKEGRQELRERVTIEHSLARVGRVQGHRARYRGARKNTLDLRRCAVIVNLQTIDRDRKAA
jgi:transposase